MWWTASPGSGKGGKQSSDIFSKLKVLRWEWKDPETGKKWVLVSINVHGDVEEVLNQYEGYIEDWVSSVPWPQRDKIRLSFNIV